MPSAEAKMYCSHKGSAVLDRKNKLVEDLVRGFGYTFRIDFKSTHWHILEGLTQKNHWTQKTGESRNCYCCELLGCGHRGYWMEFGHRSPSCNQHQTLIDCLFCHIIGLSIGHLRPRLLGRVAKFRIKSPGTLHGGDGIWKAKKERTN